MGQVWLVLYITEDFRISVQEVLDNALKGTETANFEFPLFTKQGTRVEVLLNADAAAVTRRGRVIGVGWASARRPSSAHRVAQGVYPADRYGQRTDLGIDAKGG